MIGVDPGVVAGCPTGHCERDSVTTTDCTSLQYGCIIKGASPVSCSSRLCSCCLVIRRPPSDTRTLTLSLWYQDRFGERVLQAKIPSKASLPLSPFINHGESSLARKSPTTYMGYTPYTSYMVQEDTCHLAKGAVGDICRCHSPQANQSLSYVVERRQEVVFLFFVFLFCFLFFLFCFLFSCFLFLVSFFFLCFVFLFCFV